MPVTQLSLWQSEPPRHVATRAPGKVRTRPASQLPTRQLAPEALDELAQQWEDDAHTARTKRAYRADLAAFEHWCALQGACALPASTETLRRYLMALALRGLRPSTIRRARKSIGLAHAHAGLPRPDRDGRIRSLEFSIGKKLGVREEGATPLLLEQLDQLVRVFRDSPRDDRDRAVVLVGFAGAFRSCELAGMRVEHVHSDARGLRIFLPRSKEDQLGRGDEVPIRPSTHDLERCPVDALKRWIGRVGSPAGPLFRPVRHGGVIEHARLCERTISRIVEAAAARAGLVGDFSSHSLRRGYATSATEAGVDPAAIQAHGRWAYLSSLHRYIDTDLTPRRRAEAANIL